MAITVVNEPDTSVIHPINQDTIISMTSTNSSEPKFRFIVEVELNGTVIATLRPHPNEQGLGIVNLRKILRDHIKPDIVREDDTDQFIAGQDVAGSALRLISDNETTIGEVDVNFGESYAATADDPPTDYTGLATEKYFMSPAVRQYDQGFHSIGLLEDGVTVKGVLKDDTCEFLHDGGRKYTDGSDEVVEFNVNTFDRFMLAYFQGSAWGTVCEKFTLNLYLNSGGPPSSHDITVGVGGYGGTTYASAVVRESYLQFLRCGPKDLSDNILVAANAKPNDTNDWSYYTIQAKDTSFGGSDRSKVYRFNKVCAPVLERFTLMWKNSFGVWQMQGFTKKHEEQIRASSKQYRKVIGDFNASTFAFNKFDRGLTDFRKDAHKEFTIRTDWMTEEEADGIKSYILNGDVYLFRETSEIPMPVNVLDATYMVKKKYNDGLISLQVKVRHSQNLVTS